MPVLNIPDKSVDCALILAAGKGERLKPITDRIPKPLIQVGQYKLIEYHIFNLAKSGVKNIYINRAHLREMFDRLLNPSDYQGVTIKFLDEPDGALETAGAIINAFKSVSTDQLLVVNGDIWCDFNFININKLFDINKVDSHIILTKNPDHNPAGDFCIDNNLLNKVATGKQTYTFTGIGIYKRHVFEQLDETYCKLAPVLHRLIEDKRISASLHDGVWMDIGTAQRLKQARDYLKSI